MGGRKQYYRPPPSHPTQNSKMDSSVGKQAKHWCFTLNNYSEDEEFTALPTGAVYLVVGKEVGASGTPHLQGFISFSKPRRLGQLKKLRLRANWSVARSFPNAYEYCKKTGDFSEYGEQPKVCKPSVKSGQRNELRLFMDRVKEGLHDPKVLREEFPNIFARYLRFAETYIRDHLPVPAIEIPPLRPWQESLLSDVSLGELPSDRHVIFVVDEEGNQGKSFLCRLVRQGAFEGRIGKSLILGAGKKADLSYAFSKAIPYPSVVFIDVPRSKMETLHYDFLEEIKNGYLFSPKYESVQISFPIPHLVVLCNEQPDFGKLSADRYKIVNL
jgi:Putative viral replication protein